MSTRRLALLGTMATAMAMGVLSGTATESALATVAASNGRIAYQETFDKGNDIFSVRPDGTGNTRLTFSRNSQHPIWSPFGQRIAYERAGAVWVMRADGSGKLPLVRGQLVGWMPSGGRILVARGLGPDAQDGVDPTWLLVRVSTGEAEPLSIDLPLVPGLQPPYPGYDEWSRVNDATLSPDGTLLGLTLVRDDYGPDDYSYWYGSFFTVRLDGTGLDRVGSVYDPDPGAAGWSPDSRQLVYTWAEPRSGCHDGVLSLRLDGRAGSARFGRACFESDPTWSPDGSLIAFGSASAWGGLPATLKTSTLDGSQITTVLSSTDHWYHDPDWRRLP